MGANHQRPDLGRGARARRDPHEGASQAAQGEELELGAEVVCASWVCVDPALGELLQ